MGTASCPGHVLDDISITARTESECEDTDGLAVLFGLGDDCVSSSTAAVSKQEYSLLQS